MASPRAEPALRPAQTKDSGRLVTEARLRTPFRSSRLCLAPLKWMLRPLQMCGRARSEECLRHFRISKRPHFLVVLDVAVFCAHEVSHPGVCAGCLLYTYSVYKSVWRSISCLRGGLTLNDKIFKFFLRERSRSRLLGLPPRAGRRWTRRALRRRTLESAQLPRRSRRARTALAGTIQ